MEQISPFSTRVVATAARTSAPDADSATSAHAPRGCGGVAPSDASSSSPASTTTATRFLPAAGSVDAQIASKSPFGARHARCARLGGDGEPPSLDGAVGGSGLVGPLRGERPGSVRPGVVAPVAEGRGLGRPGQERKEQRCEHADEKDGTGPARDGRHGVPFGGAIRDGPWHAPRRRRPRRADARGGRRCRVGSDPGSAPHTSTE